MYIVGSDEVGYGSWAGPLVVAAVGAPKNWTLGCLADSKKLSRSKITSAYRTILESPDITIRIFYATSRMIDVMGMAYVHKEVHRKAIFSVLDVMPGADVVLDGTMTLRDLPRARSIPRADSSVPVVMAASIVAKFNRDLIMIEEMDKKYPEYGFAAHVGYGTPAHQDALRQHGPCEIHRMSIKPLRKM
jgi:ribonuclease HII